MKRIVIILSLIQIVLYSSCRSKPVADVYIAGWKAINNNENTQQACYWKNDKLVIIEKGTAISEANSIFADGQDVYAAGAYDGKPCYWKNGIRVMLSDKEARATSVTVANHKVYITGGEGELLNNHPWIWKNGTFEELSKMQGSAQNVYVKGEDIYVSGSEDHKVCYWKNGKKVDLNQPGVAIKLVTDQTDVYVAGAALESQPQGGYWKNEVFHPLEKKGKEAGVTGIAVHDSKLYAAGISEGKAMIWIDGKFDSALPADGASQARDITFDGSDLYIVGLEENKKAKVEMLVFNACYWKNGKKVLLDTSTGGSQANAIYIKTE
jgi:hypothetical protein